MCRIVFCIGFFVFLCLACGDLGLPRPFGIGYLNYFARLPSGRGGPRPFGIGYLNYSARLPSCRGGRTHEGDAAFLVQTPQGLPTPPRVGAGLSFCVRPLQAPPGRLGRLKRTSHILAQGVVKLVDDFWKMWCRNICKFFVFVLRKLFARYLFGIVGPKFWKTNSTTPSEKKQKLKI